LRTLRNRQREVSGGSRRRATPAERRLTTAPSVGNPTRGSRKIWGGSDDAATLAASGAGGRREPGFRGGGADAGAGRSGGDALARLPYPGAAYSPYARRRFPSLPLWGDTHLHTGLSVDAGLFGAWLGLEDAYRFARGEEVVSNTGLPVKLARPLNWLVIADHSDAMGFFNDLATGAPGIPEGAETVRGDYAERRAKWERLVEVTQPKGTGEAHPFLSPDDAFADFELLDKGNLSGSNDPIQAEAAWPCEASQPRCCITGWCQMSVALASLSY
jgi:hypothetical protein